MDYYLNSENSKNRLLEEFRKYGTLVIAFDFDDTVYDFHKKGRLYDDVVALLRKLKEIGCYLICWTGQEDLVFVLRYLKENAIPFDAINENPLFRSSLSRKIYANAFLDDRAGLKQVYDELDFLIQNLENEKNI